MVKDIENQRFTQLIHNFLLDYDTSRYKLMRGLT